MAGAAAALPEKRRGATYQAIFWLFLFGSVAGFILEGLWNVLRKGAWESHPATVFGPFCVIYGVGAVVAYLLAAELRGKSLPLQFVLFAAAGTAVEYAGSVFQERLFGSISWDYSGHFLNLGGRVSLQMALLWGVLGTAFARLAFPALARLLGNGGGRARRFACNALSMLLAVDLLLSAAAVTRWKDRLGGDEAATNPFEQFLDETYDDQAMARRYPNLRFSERGGT